MKISDSKKSVLTCFLNIYLLSFTKNIMYVQMQSRDTNVDEKHCKTIDNDKMYEGFIKIVLTVILYNGYKCFFKGKTYSKYSYQHLKNPSNVA